MKFGLAALVAMVVLASPAGAAHASAQAGERALADRSAVGLCPAVAPTQQPARIPGAGGELVPSGATAVLLCRYHGLNPPQRARLLERARLVSRRSTVLELTAELNALPRMPKAISCPMDDGSEILASFRYPQQPPDLVFVGLSGCRIVTNGRLTRTAIGPTGARLIAQLIRLTP